MTGGAALAGRWWTGVVQPLVAQRWPRLPVAAARLGPGSDALGYDDAVSRDHDWGLRLALAVEDGLARVVDEYLAAHLPDTFEGHPVRFPTSGDASARHRIEVAPAAVLCERRLGVDPARGMDLEDWLSVTGQAVLEVTAGPVFTDPLSRLTAARDALRWYPDDVWRYAVASGWNRIDQDLPLVGRTGQVGDDAGSRALAARITATTVHLAFLLGRTWPPYAKWRGIALLRLPGGAALVDALAVVTAADHWPRRQTALADVLDLLLDRQRASGLEAGPGRATRRFHARPFLQVATDAVRPVLEALSNEDVRALPQGLGVIEQWVDAVDVLVDPTLRRAAVRAVVAGSGGTTGITAAPEPAQPRSSASTR